MRISRRRFKPAVNRQGSTVNSKAPDSCGSLPTDVEPRRLCPRTAGIFRLSPIAWQGSKTPGACREATVRPDRGTPDLPAIMPLAQACPCAGRRRKMSRVWGWSSREYRSIRRRHTQSETEMGKAPPGIPGEEGVYRIRGISGEGGAAMTDRPGTDGFRGGRTWSSLRWHP